MCVFVCVHTYLVYVYVEYTCPCAYAELEEDIVRKLDLSTLFP